MGPPMAVTARGRESRFEQIGFKNFVVSVSPKGANHPQPGATPQENGLPAIKPCKGDPNALSKVIWIALSGLGLLLDFSQGVALGWE